MARSETGDWKEALPTAVNALHNQRKTEVLHGARPTQVRHNPEVRFMMLEDQAENAEHNRNLTEKRVFPSCGGLGRTENRYLGTGCLREGTRPLAATSETWQTYRDLPSQTSLGAR